jgi:hypothetical protein
MSARSIRQLSVVSALVLGAFACGPVDSEPTFETETLQLAGPMQTGTVELTAVQDARTQSGSASSEASKRVEDGLARRGPVCVSCRLIEASSAEREHALDWYERALAQLFVHFQARLQIAQR